MPFYTNQDCAKELKLFGRRLQERRRESGATPQAFAEKCGMSYKHYLNLEHGNARPSMLTYISICRTLGLKPPMIGG